MDAAQRKRVLRRILNYFRVHSRVAAALAGRRCLGYND